MKQMMIESGRGFVKMNRNEMENVEGGSLTAIIIAAVVSLVAAVSCNQTTTVNVYGGNECKTKTSSDTTSISVSADVPIGLK